MKKVKVSLKERSYNILIGSGIIRYLGKELLKLNLGDSAYVITNKNIMRAHGRALSMSLKQSGFNTKFKPVPDTEESKSLAAASLVLKDIAAFDKKKKIFIIAFGGGVIGDLGGFVASIYKRGIPYINIPTTLLAQVDSGIGGKTAVDLKEGKNLVGSFYQPKLTLSDTSFLATLDKRQLRSGLAEIIKYGAIKDAALFAYIESNYKKIISCDKNTLEFVITRSSEIKAGIVSEDEKEEKGVRTILNFGHTIGHAIEAACHYKGYTHGEAIALGMIVACGIARGLGLLKAKESRRIGFLINAAGLPVKAKNISIKKVIEAHYRDKKFIGAKNRLVLIKGIGKACVVKNIDLKVINEALKEIF
jgi:3-dehydroquinate synthase